MAAPTPEASVNWTFCQTAKLTSEASVKGPCKMDILQNGNANVGGWCKMDILPSSDLLFQFLKRKSNCSAA
jgi:hypothetical protein